jgi:hypothetical protein
VGDELEVRRLACEQECQIELLDRQIAYLKQQSPAQGQTRAAFPRLSQRRGMAERLRNDRGTVRIVYDLACEDCGQYATDFIQTLGDAEGWTVERGGVMGPTNRPASGLAIRLPDLNKPTSEAQRFIRALKVTASDSTCSSRIHRRIGQSPTLKFLLLRLKRRSLFYRATNHPCDFSLSIAARRSPFQSKNRIDFPAAPKHANGMPLPDCIPALFCSMLP